MPSDMRGLTTYESQAVPDMRGITPYANPRPWAFSDMRGLNFGDPYFFSDVLLLHMDGADASTVFPDKSPVVTTVTAAGDAQIDTVQSKFGGACALFDGTTDRLGFSRIGYEFLTNTLESFTLECWIRPTTSFANYRAIFSIGYNAGANYGFNLNCDITTGIITATISGNGGAWAVGNTSAILNQWQHVAVTYTVGTSTLAVWVNGVAAGTGVKGAGSFSSPAYDAQIGSYGSVDAYALGFLGWIDDFRITRGVVRYTANFTPPTSAFLDF